MPYSTALERSISVKEIELGLEKEMSSLTLCKGQVERPCDTIHTITQRSVGKHEYSEFYVDLWPLQKDSRVPLKQYRYMYIGIWREINHLHKFLFQFKRLPFNFPGEHSCSNIGPSFQTKTW